MTSILVTGGAGYIGSHTCKALRRAGFDPVTYDNLARGNSEAVKWGALDIGELTDQTNLRATLVRYRPAAVVHFAALTDVGESNRNPPLYYQNKVGGTAALLAAMRERDVGKLIFSSSCAVYGVPAVVPTSEEAPYAPINPYAKPRWSASACWRNAPWPFHCLLFRCVTSTPPALIRKVRSVRARSRRRMRSSSCSTPQPAKAQASRFTVMIIRRQMARGCATTSM